MTRLLAAAALLAALPAFAQAAQEPPSGSRELERITIPAKRADNETTATFKSKLKKGRLYAVRFSGSYEIDGTGWDPAYCFDGTCPEPRPQAVSLVQHWRRVKGEEPRYSHAANFFEAYDDYPAFQADHAYTLAFSALFHTQLRTSACPFTACDDVGSFQGVLFQRPFPVGFLRLWGQDCRDGERYDTTPITFSSGQCERVVLSAESGAKRAGRLRLQRKRRRPRPGRPKWKNIGPSADAQENFPTAVLDIGNGRGTDKFRAVLIRGDDIVQKSNVVTINWIG